MSSSRGARLARLIAFAGGIVSLTLFPSPLFSNRTYFSENALSPDSSATSYDATDLAEARAWTKRLYQRLELIRVEHANDTASRRHALAARWMAQSFRGAGMMAVEHTFRAAWCTRDCQRSIAYAMIKAPRGDGKEALVLTTTYDVDFEASSSTAYDRPLHGFGIMMSLYRRLIQNNWLAKDVLLVVVPAAHVTDATSAWLDAYQGTLPRAGARAVDPAFPRSGRLQAALGVDIVSEQVRFVACELEGPHLPNLDLVNVARFGVFSGWDRRLDLSIGTQRNLGLGSFVVRRVLPLLPSRMRTFALMMWNYAIGVPTGAHGVFNARNVDAITLWASPTRRPALSVPNSGFRFAVTVEFILRCLNNTLEHLHQSFYFYVLPASTAYVSIGQYMPVVAALAAFVPLHTLALYYGPARSSNVAAASGPAALLLAGGSVVTLVPWALPDAFAHLPGASTAWAAVSSLCCAVACVAAVVVVRRRAPEVAYDDAGLQVLLGMAASLWLFTHSLVNWAFCAAACVLTVPLFATLSVRSSRTGVALVQWLWAALVNPLTVWLLASQWLSGASPLETAAAAWRAYRVGQPLLLPFVAFVWAPLAMAHVVHLTTRRPKPHHA